MLLSVDSLNLDNYDLLYKYILFNKGFHVIESYVTTILSSFVSRYVKYITSVVCPILKMATHLPPFPIDHQKKLIISQILTLYKPILSHSSGERDDSIKYIFSIVPFFQKSCLSSLYVLPFICNCVLVSSSVLTTLKTDGGLRIFKNAPNEFKDVPNEFEEALKRHSIDCHSDKRENPQGCSGSFFVRDERSDPDRGKERFYNGDGDRGSNRSPRTWKSPDIVIRFGRAGFKNLNREQKRGRNDLNFIR